MAAARLAGSRRASLTCGRSLRGVVAGRPVGPQPVDEGEVVHRHRHVGQRVLEEEHVPGPLQLVVGEEGAGQRRRGRHGHRHQAPPPGRRGGGPPRRRPAPPSRGRRARRRRRRRARRAGATASSASTAGLVVPVGGYGRRRIPAQPGGHRPVARRGQGGEQMPPRPRRVGEPVQAQGQRRVRVAGREVGERQPVGLDGALRRPSPRGSVMAGTLTHGEPSPSGPPGAAAGDCGHTQRSRCTAWVTSLERRGATRGTFAERLVLRGPGFDPVPV